MNAPVEPVSSPLRRRVVARLAGWSLRRRVVVAVLVVVALAAAAAAGAGVWAWWRFESIPTFGSPPEHSTLPTLPAPDDVPAPVVVDEVEVPRSFLVFSTGSAGVDRDEAAAAGVGAERGDDPDGLTDTLAVVAISADGQRVAVVSVPRDTWVASVSNRINTVFLTAGVDALVAEMAALTGVVAEHQVAVNFAGFADLVDAVGGVRVAVTAPMRDPGSGLSILDAGCVRLDGPSALALVRSRNLEVFDGQRWRRDVSADDFGRIARQQTVGAAVFAELAVPSSVTRVGELFDVAGDNLVVDDALSLADVVSLAQVVAGGGVSVRFWSVPGEIGWAGRASVVFVDEAGAAAVRDEVAAWLAGDAPVQPPVPGPEESPAAVEAPGVDRTGGVSRCG